MPLRLYLISATVAVMVMAVGVFGREPFDGAPIKYYTAAVDDPLARLQKRIDAGEVTLDFDKARQGYLASVLRELNVSVSSQMLVFSKTSFQRRYISPHAPRAVYYSDDMYVGWVQGGKVLEFSAVDPRQGAIFYSLQQQSRGTGVLSRGTGVSPVREKTVCSQHRRDALFTAQARRLCHQKFLQRCHLAEVLPILIFQADN